MAIVCLSVNVLITVWLAQEYGNGLTVGEGVTVMLTQASGLVYMCWELANGLIAIRCLEISCERMTNLLLRKEKVEEINPC